MSRLLIIGYGNPQRGDDGLGWHAADQLRKTIDDPEVEILAVHQLTPELMDPVSRARRAIFIDACQDGEPGEIRERRVGLAAGKARFTHHFTPESLVEGAKSLFGTAPEAVLYTVCGASFELGAELSAPVRNAMELLLRTISETWLS
jgi:hydrogenase maturation protease